MIHSKRFLALALALASIAVSLNTMAGLRTGVAGHFMEVRTPAARGKLLNSSRATRGRPADPFRESSQR